MTGVAVEAAIDTPQEQTFLFEGQNVSFIYDTQKSGIFNAAFEKMKIRIFDFFLVWNALLHYFIAWTSYKK